MHPLLLKELADLHAAELARQAQRAAGAGSRRRQRGSLPGLAGHLLAALKARV